MSILILRVGVEDIVGGVLRFGIGDVVSGDFIILNGLMTVEKTNNEKRKVES